MSSSSCVLVHVVPESGARHGSFGQKASWATGGSDSAAVGALRPMTRWAKPGILFRGPGRLSCLKLLFIYRLSRCEMTCVEIQVRGVLSGARGGFQELAGQRPEIRRFPSQSATRRVSARSVPACAEQSCCAVAVGGLARRRSVDLVVARAGDVLPRSRAVFSLLPIDGRVFDAVAPVVGATITRLVIEVAGFVAEGRVCGFGPKRAKIVARTKWAA